MGMGNWCYVFSGDGLKWTKRNGQLGWVSVLKQTHVSHCEVDCERESASLVFGKKFSEARFLLVLKH